MRVLSVIMTFQLVERINEIRTRINPRACLIPGVSQNIEVCLEFVLKYSQQFVCKNPAFLIARPGKATFHTCQQVWDVLDAQFDGQDWKTVLQRNIFSPVPVSVQMSLKSQSQHQHQHHHPSRNSCGNSNSNSHRKKQRVEFKSSGCGDRPTSLANANVTVDVTALTYTIGGGSGEC